ncbi:MAG: hypothetical protein QM737_08595 [Ferruginibacter sp.]
MQRTIQLLAFFFIHSISFAQLDYGKISSPKAVVAFKKKDCIACDPTKGVNNIYESKNELEIRLHFVDSNNVIHLYVLSYDSLKNWSCILILDTISDVKDRKLLMKNPSKKYLLTPDISYETVFNTLKENKIFKLQSDPGFEFRNQYSILFKAGKKICYYLFSNLSTIGNPNVQTDAVYYFNILDIFKNHFKVNN